MSSRYYISHLNVIHEVIDGEAVVINLEHGNYYSMNDSGAYLWQLIQNGFNEEQITAIMSEQFSISSETAKASLKVFLDHLLEEQLIISVETLPVKEQVMVESKEMVYNPPELTVFNDMQELLLLDPIHEISEQGWPHFAQNTLEKF